MCVRAVTLRLWHGSTTGSPDAFTLEDVNRERSHHDPRPPIYLPATADIRARGVRPGGDGLAGDGHHRRRHPVEALAGPALAQGDDGQRDDLAVAPCPPLHAAVDPH